MSRKSDSLIEIVNAVAGKTARQHTTALIAAAGASLRMGGVPKQFAEINGIPVIARTLMAYQAAATVDEIVLVARREDFDALIAIAREYRITKLRRVTEGGATRQESVRRGLSVLSPETRYISIADGARCLTTPEQIDLVNRTAYRTSAASAATPATDSVKIANARGVICDSPDRATVWLAQTPQTFSVELYRAAAYSAVENGFEVTDDNLLVEKINRQVYLVDCGKENIKITTPVDLDLAKAILDRRGKTTDSGKT